MILRPRALTLIFSLCVLSTVNGQNDAGITFNKVTPGDFSITNFKVDTSFGAVIVADIGKSYFEGNNEGGFTLVHNVKRRVKIIDKKGFDLATVNVQLFKDNSGEEEKLENVKASTYNLEDGKVVEARLGKDDIFKDKLNEKYLVRKFTMPAIREGSIIEYSYTIKSDFIFNLQPWSFQGSYPILWSEYEVSIPSFFRYVTLTRGYLPFHLKTTTIKSTTYTVAQQGSGLDQGTSFKTERFSLPSDNTISKWAIKNVPALKEEKFTSSMENHISAIEFQLSAIHFPNTAYRPYMGTWESVTEELMNNKNFGAELSLANRWVNKEPELSEDGPVTLDEAQKIFRFVQGNIKNKGSRGFYLSQSLKETFKNKSGYVSDINLLLTLILESKGFKAAPVLLSTRSNGTALEIYPLINRFNYVICKLSINDKDYYLDASQSYLGFNKLASYCYNGPARVINKSSDAEYFLADNLDELKSTNVILMLDNDNPKNWLGFVHSKLGYNESCNKRRVINEKGKDEVLKGISNLYTGDFKASDVELIKLEKSDEDLLVKYNIDIDNSNNDIIYFSPMMREGLGENPFKSENRFYPVEMPYKLNETYSIKLDIPSGYVIDEIPTSERVLYNETEGMFEYLVFQSEKEISIKTTVKLNRANFTNADYESLRGFFGHIVKKQAEQIVLKKK